MRPLVIQLDWVHVLGGNGVTVVSEENVEFCSKLSTIFLKIFYLNSGSITTNSKPGRRNMQRGVAWLSRTSACLGGFLLVSTFPNLSGTWIGVHVWPLSENLGFEVLPHFWIRGPVFHWVICVKGEDTWLCAYTCNLIRGVCENL